MAWVNLNDVYVNKAGGTITGDLEVDGNLTINDATGNGTTYNVANEISTLRDSVSQWWKPPYTTNKVLLTRTGNIVMMSGNVKFNTSGQCNYNKVDETLPTGFRPTADNISVIFSFDGNFALLMLANGNINALGNPNNAYACCTGSWYTTDAFPK